MGWHCVCSRILYIFVESSIHIYAYVPVPLYGYCGLKPFVVNNIYVCAGSIFHKKPDTLIQIYYILRPT